MGITLGSKFIKDISSMFSDSSSLFSKDIDKQLGLCLGLCDFLNKDLVFVEAHLKQGNVFVEVEGDYDQVIDLDARLMIFSWRLSLNHLIIVECINGRSNVL